MMLVKFKNFKDKLALFKGRKVLRLNFLKEYVLVMNLPSLKERNVKGYKGYVLWHTIK